MTNKNDELSEDEKKLVDQAIKSFQKAKKQGSEVAQRASKYFIDKCSSESAAKQKKPKR